MVIVYHRTRWSILIKFQRIPVLFLRKYEITTNIYHRMNGVISNRHMFMNLDQQNYKYQYEFTAQSIFFGDLVCIRKEKWLSLHSNQN